MNDQSLRQGKAKQLCACTCTCANAIATLLGLYSACSKAVGLARRKQMHVHMSPCFPPPSIDWDS